MMHIINNRIDKITRLVFDNIFENESCDAVVDFLTNYYEPYLKNKPIGKHELRIAIDSPGGRCDAGIVMIKYIVGLCDKYNVQLKTYIRSMAYSMGSVLFMVGEERYMSRHSLLGFHVISGGVSQGKMQEVLSKVERMVNTYDELIELYALRMGKEWATELGKIIEYGKEHTLYLNTALEQKVITGSYELSDF